jgi:recombination protein RecA
MAEKKKSYPAVIDVIREQFGEGSIQLIGDAPNMDVEAISTGSINLDRATGVGGVPYGRITEVFGPEGSGKTTLCQHLVANAQKEGKQCAYVDMEHALDLSYVERTGVDIEKLYISQPDTGEQALEIVEALVRSGEFGLVVVDSVAALVPHKELNDSDMGDAVMGSQARLMSQAMRKLAGVIKKTNTAVVFTNQLRQKIGVMFGNPETTPGGLALKFYAGMRIDLRRRELLKSGSTVVGSRIKVRIVKNKVGPPFQNAEFEIRFNEGISKVGELLTLGVEQKVLTKKGSFYYYGEEKLGQGKEAAKMTLKSKKKLFEEVNKKVLEALDDED